MPEQHEFQQRLQSIEQLLSDIEGAADPNLRRTVQELMQLIMDLHGAGLERILEILGSDGQAEAPVPHIVSRLSRDELVGSLLVLYGLHPLDLEARVGQALEKVRARLRAHSGEVHLQGIQDGVVRLRLDANNAHALKETIEQTIYQYAPDVTALIIEGAGAKPGFVPIEMLQGVR